MGSDDSTPKIEVNNAYRSNRDCLAYLTMLIFVYIKIIKYDDLHCSDGIIVGEDFGFSPGDLHGFAGDEGEVLLPLAVHFCFDEFAGFLQLEIDAHRGAGGGS